MATRRPTRRPPARRDPRAAALRVGLASAVAVGAVGMAAALASAPVAIMAAGPLMAGLLLYVGPVLRPFMPAIEAVDLGSLVSELDPALSYAPRAYLSEEVYLASGLAHGSYDAYGGGHLIEGSWRGQPLSLSKLRLVRRAPEPLVVSLDDEDDGRPPGLPRFIPVFHGLFYAITLPAPIDGFVVARPRGAAEAGRPAPDGVAVKLDDIAFDAVYAVHASDPALARAVLTSERRTALLTLVLGAEKPVELAIRGDRAYLAVPGARAFIESVVVRSEIDPPGRDLTRRDLLAALAIPQSLALGEPIAVTGTPV